MPREFQGKIALDIRDSEQDWGAFLADKATERAPNVLVEQHLAAAMARD